MILDWYMAGPGASASYKNFVFRVHKTTIEKKFGYSNNEKGIFNVFKLQIKEKHHITFKDLDYIFYTEDYPTNGHYYAKKDSIDEVIWESVNDIVIKVEEILIALSYIPKTRPTPTEFDQLFMSSVSYSIVKSLKDAKMLKTKFTDAQASDLPILIQRSLYQVLTTDKSQFYDDDGLVDRIKLAEFEVEMVQEILKEGNNLSNYYRIKDNWNNEKPSHDIEWLKDYLNKKQEFFNKL